MKWVDDSKSPYGRTLVCTGAELDEEMERHYLKFFNGACNNADTVEGREETLTILFGLIKALVFRCIKFGVVGLVECTLELSKE